MGIGAGEEDMPLTMMVLGTIMVQMICIKQVKGKGGVVV